jgi:hypothetical protein
VILLCMGKGNRKFYSELFFRSDKTISATWVNVRPPLFLVSGCDVWRRAPKHSMIRMPGEVTFTTIYRKVT